MIWNREFSEGDGGKISIVIPVLNESATITSVVQYALNSPLVDEVIVVDDGSIDGTPELAAAAGARVITSSMLGKGASMEDGMRASKNKTIMFLDGDLAGLDESVIESMAAPILNDNADFVKAKFSRAAGRVTVLTAKPLIRTYFPELRQFDQPLSGIMAARKSLLEQLTFENDYGVDVGLLIDASLARARLAEVDIGSLEHRSHSLQDLGEMATQVARALLERAARAGRLRLSYIRESKENERIETLDLNGLLDRIPAGTQRIALFDMDGVLLNGRFVVSLAQETNRESDLAALLDNYAISPLDRMRQIAAVFAGVRKETFEKVARELPLMPGVQDTMIALKKAGYRVGIVTDSYNVAAETVRRRVFADFTFSHFMRFKNGKASGKVNICPAMIHPAAHCEHDHCKVNVLKHLMERFDICSDSIVAVGDGENDICMLKAAGCSIAFQPKNRRVRNAAKFTATRMQEVPWFAGAMRIRERHAEAAETDLTETVSN